MTREEGVIKFSSRHREAPPLSRKETQSLIDYRQKLFALNLIGVYPDGIGFGNISERCANPQQFIISASQTGHLANVSPEHFSLVTKYSIDRNWVESEGSLPASSESLTHAMIYELFPSAKAVIHVHHHRAWQRLQHLVPTTEDNVPYGTPAMADAVARLARTSELPMQKILVMAGHEDGILSFGDSFEEAFAIVTDNLLPELGC